MFKFIKKHQKATKITAIVILSLAVLAVGAILILNKLIGDIKPPEEISASEDFEYDTLDVFKERFEIPEEELALDINDYAETEAYKVYRRAFSKFINSGNFYISTEGFTNAAGIYVNISNEKKFDGVNFFMHQRSLADGGGMFAQASDGSTRHYLYVNPDGTTNYATIERLNPYNESELLKEKVLSEKDYVYNYGTIPYVSCSYIINEDTILSSALSYDSQSGLYVITFNLDPVPSTVNQVKNMYATSGTDVSYKDGLVEYTVYIDSNFTIRKVDIVEEYAVTALGISMSANAGTTDTYYYPGETGYKPLSKSEKYDTTNIPVVENSAEAKEIKTAMSNAIDRVLNNSVNANLSLSVDGEKLLDGRLQVLAKDYTVIELDTVIEGMPIYAHIEFKADGSGNVLVDVQDLKFGFTFNKLSQVITTILDKVNIDLGGLSTELIGEIVDNFSVKDIIQGFKQSEGQKKEGKFVYTANLREVSSIPLDIPFDIVVSDNKIESFKIDNKAVMGAVIDLALTPCTENASISLQDMESDRADLTPVLFEALDLVLSAGNEQSIAGKVLNQLSQKQFGISGTATYQNTTINIENIKIENVGEQDKPLQAFMNGQISVLANVKVGENISATLTYVNNELFVDYNGMFGAKMPAQVIAYLIGAVLDNREQLIDSFDLAEIEELLEKISQLDSVSIPQVLSMIKTLDVSEQEINIAIDISTFDFGINQIAIRVFEKDGEIALAVVVDDTLSVDLTVNNQTFESIVAPSGDYIDLSDTSLIDAALKLALDFNVDGSVINTLVKQLSSKQFTLNGDVEVDGSVITIKELKIDIRDGISASGSIILGSDEISFVYVGGNIYASYSDVASITMDKATIDYLVNTILNNYEEILNGFNLSEVLDMIEDAKDMESMKIADIFNMLKAISIDEDGSINLTIDGARVNLSDIALKLYINTDKLLSVDGTIGTNTVKLSVDNTAFEQIVAPTGDYIDLSDTSLIDAALKLALDFNVDGSVINTLVKQLSSKQFTLNGDVEVDGSVITIKELKIDIRDGISASGSIILGSDEISFVYVGGNIYASYSDVASITMDKATIDYLVNTILNNYEEILNGFNLSEVLDMIEDAKDMESMKIADIFNMLKAISIDEDGSINLTIDGARVNLSDIALKLYINTDKLLSVDGTIGTNLIKLSVDNTAFESIVAPSGEYIDLSDTSLIDAALNLLKTLNTEGSVVNTVYNMIGQRYFNFSGEIVIDGMTITLQDVMVENQGDLSNPEEAFNNGDLRLKGTILIGADTKIEITYTDKTLYIMYNDEIGAKLERVSLDYILNLVIDNYGLITDKFDLSGLVNNEGGSIEFTSLSIGEVFAMLKNIAISKEQANITLDGGIVGLGDVILSVFFGVSGDLELSAILGENMTANIVVNNNEFTAITSPAGDFMDLSNTDYVNAIIDILKDWDEEGTVANKISKQLNNTNFNFSGSINLGGTMITLENIKVQNNGSPEDPTQAFDNGLISISGTIRIGEKDKIDIVFVDNVLYVCYNDTLRLKFDRVSLDDIVSLVLENYKQIIDRLNYSNALGSIEDAEKLKETSYADLFAMLNGLTVSKESISILINGESMGIGDITINAVIDSDGNLMLSGTLGTDGSIAITMNNDELDPITAPSGSYMDFSNSKHLIDGAINTILKESQDYYLAGTAKMVLDVPLLGDIELNLDITVSLRLVDNVGGGKSIEVVITTSCMDYSKAKANAQSFIKYGKGTMIIKDGMVYIQRENYKYSNGLFGLGSSFKSEGTSYRKETGAYFGKYTLKEIGFFLGMTDTLINLLSQDKTIKVEELLKGYTGNESVQTFTLNGSAIDSIMSDITAEITLAEYNGKKQMTNLYVSLPMSFISIVDISVTANFTHYLDQVGNYSEIGSIDSKYGSLTTLDVTE